jgi:hypothetical protein
LVAIALRLQIKLVREIKDVFFASTTAEVDAVSRNPPFQRQTTKYLRRKIATF